MSGKMIDGPKSGDVEAKDMPVNNNEVMVEKSGETIVTETKVVVET